MLTKAELKSTYMCTCFPLDVHVHTTGAYILEYTYCTCTAFCKFFFFFTLQNYVKITLKKYIYIKKRDFIVLWYFGKILKMPDNDDLLRYPL